MKKESKKSLVPKKYPKGKSKRKTVNNKQGQKKNKHRPLPKKSKHKRGKKKSRNFLLKEFWKEISITFFIVSMLFFLSSRLFFALPAFEGYGMAPTLNEGDRVYVNRLKAIKRFKIVYFKVPKSNDYSIRRVIGLPGEEVSYKNDQLFVEQQPITERFLATARYRAKQEERLVTEDFSISMMSNGSQQKIPKGKYLVLGDNRPYSTDSRYYGLIDEKDIVGVAEMRIWPLHRCSSLLN